ncbi:hypothetical protein BD770DRAFT_29338 [Pilaira anomala]|nr:hypothetical protein BD770DRAFT_29338 [Pilaira anomala]
MNGKDLGFVYIVDPLELNKSIFFRPLSKNAQYEAPPDKDAPFDYNAKPDKFYFEAETVGSLAPEEVVTMAMKTLVDKLAYVQMQIQEEVDTKEQDNANAWSNY